ncbi:MAG TPA: hypothetical protein VHM27_16435 [Rhizomicrobium sp.]|jgi:hypothetical protein|nr:hypothetical protein [Rhizomicrobium sp.]
MRLGDAVHQFVLGFHIGADAVISKTVAVIRRAAATGQFAYFPFASHSAWVRHSFFAVMREEVPRSVVRQMTGAASAAGAAAADGVWVVAADGEAASVCANAGAPQKAKTASVNTVRLRIFRIPQAPV